MGQRNGVVVRAVGGTGCMNRSKNQNIQVHSWGVVFFEKIHYNKKVRRALSSVGRAVDS